MTHSALFTPLALPCGAVIPNRLAKAAMEENMAVPGQLPGDTLTGLYRRWAEGGIGLIITGNVMVDGRAMTGPGGVVLQQGTPLEPFKRWAKAAQEGGAQVWMQLNHPGRQVFASMGGNCWAPSAVALDMGKHSHLFGQPKAMDEAEIAELIERFASSAQLAEQAGFHGVQIHAAHGYLLSQFLSPLSNRRTDQWGGALENRARLLCAVIRAVRARVSPGFAVAVKINSADFQRGGFDAADALATVQLLNQLPVDLLELSGGSYESPAMQGRTTDGRTLAREAYFLEFAAQLAGAARMPLMTTGGIRRRAVAEQVIVQGVAMVGMATALTLAPDLPARWRTGEDAEASLPPVTWSDKTMAALATMSVIKRQLRRLGARRNSKPDASPLLSLILDRLRVQRLTRRYRNWLTQQKQA
ncbi:NADH:flavin oxidoreductase/NADH oxidase family protein [Pseudomonas sp. N040]|uniref:NADH:flavin oxidoreductase/NADH oxidase family protein n=1 Tax=Pseudomonas sp. N040 TaxID=2785325 RepID=UPI0018A2E390|nr:NADH:flavin oxidoreductase/NADH oxidase family protein [Pseudomonas sp. N040]MBF7730446.1 NADH:flavin oxidoreductase/NADH oxidase family protein [Pseudomonas sp. N040]MBW7014089.1 NADH:flavin oxidoreductase/NADH oxidase family protein [Pseudomonas sp. N040]